MKNIKENIYIGDREDANDSEKLSDNNIETVITLNREKVLDPNHMNRRSYRAYHLLDNGANPQEQVDAAVFAVAGEIDSGNNFLVHCSAGISRSSTILAAALALVEEQSFEDGLNYLKERYSPANPHEDLAKQARKSVKRFREGVEQ